MSQRLVFVVVLLAVVAAGVWLFSRPRAAPDGGLAPVEAADRDPDPGVADRAAGPGESPRAEEPGAERVDVDTPTVAPRAVNEHAPGDGPTLTVEVLDSVGRPAPGVMVVFAMREAEVRGAKWDSVREHESDADGRIEMRDPAAVVEAQARFQEIEGPMEAAVFAMIPVRERPSVRVALGAIPDQPVVLSLPPTGSVEVVLEHPDPNQLPGSRVRIVDRDRPRDGLWFHQRTRQADESGRALFPYVGLGVRLEVEGRLPTGNVAQEVECDGPLADQQRVTVRLPMLGDQPVLVAILEDEAHERLRSKDLVLRMRSKQDGSSSSSSFTAKSDDDGRLVLELMDDFVGDAERTLHVSMRGDTTRAVLRKLPQLHPGENDLGLLTLQPPPVVCAGIVRDRDGTPVAGARIEVRVKEHWGKKPDQFFWQYLDLDAARSGDDGRFAVVGYVDDREHVANVSCEGYLSITEQPFPAGTQGNEFVLDRAAQLTGELVLGVRFPTRRLAIEVVPVREQNPVANTEPLSNGEFRFAELEPGTVVARVRVFGWSEPVWQSAPIELRSGRTHELGEVALGDATHSIGFEVFDLDGNPVPEARAVVLEADPEQSTFEGVMLDAGRGTLIGPREVVDLLVFANGYRTTRTYGVRDGHRITLLGEVPVQVSLPAGVTIPAGATLAGSLMPVRPPGRENVNVELRGDGSTSTMSGSAPWRRGRSFSFEARTQNATVPVGGRYRLRCFVRAADGSGDPKRVDLTGDATFDIDDAGGASISVPVTQQAIDAAWESH